jgi:hypothetical protein
MRLVHIVNPYISDLETELDDVQKTTIESMVLAKKSQNNVELVAVTNKSIRLPEEFSIAPKQPLSNVDFGFNSHKSLPSLYEILKCGIDFSVKENLHSKSYIIFTNMDIILRADFYTIVQKIIENGYDSFSINRRTVLKSQIFSDSTCESFTPFVGVDHPGHDCFVFNAGLFAKFKESHSFIGTLYVTKWLQYELIARSLNYINLSQMCITYHIGDDQVWKTKVNLIQDENLRVALETLKDLELDDEYRGRLIEYSLEHYDSLIFNNLSYRYISFLERVMFYVSGSLFRLRRKIRRWVLGFDY